jgi:hypothetical protein
MDVRKTHWDQGVSFSAMHTAINLREAAYEREHAAYCSGAKTLAEVVLALRKEYRLANRIMRGVS